MELNQLARHVLCSKPFLLTSLGLLLVGFLCFVICSYYVLRFLQMSFEYNNVFFYQYNQKCRKILDEYGDHEVIRVYVVRQHLGKLVSLLFNMLTLFKYNQCLKESTDNYMYHTALLFEIKQGKHRKFLLVEKNNCINICETFLMNKTNTIRCICLQQKQKQKQKSKQKTKQKQKPTLNTILKTTQERIGNNKFFNWNICKNNCQQFTKEILVTLGVHNEECAKFIFSDMIIQKYCLLSDFSLHVIHCLFIIINFVEKYIYDSALFV